MYVWHQLCAGVYQGGDEGCVPTDWANWLSHIQNVQVRNCGRKLPVSYASMQILGLCPGLHWRRSPQTTIIPNDNFWMCFWLCVMINYRWAHVQSDDCESTSFWQSLKPTELRCRTEVPTLERRRSIWKPTVELEVGLVLGLRSGLRLGFVLEKSTISSAATSQLPICNQTCRNAL